MQQILIVAAGGSVGAAARYGVSILIARSVSSTFPWGTLVVNLTGSFFIGVFAELFETKLIPAPWRSFTAIGVIGGYTTFSTLMFESMNLIREGEWHLATLNIVASNVLGILFVILGMLVCRFSLRQIGSVS